MTKIEFDAIASGDYESFCYDVDSETFEKVCGYKPDKYDKSHFSEDKFRVYFPEHFLNYNLLLEENSEHHITIERDSDKVTITIQKIES